MWAFKDWYSKSIWHHIFTSSWYRIIMLGRHDQLWSLYKYLMTCLHIYTQPRQENSWGPGKLWGPSLQLKYLGNLGSQTLSCEFC